MADRAQPINALTWAGRAASGLVLLLILGTLGAVALRAEAGRGLGPADWAALRFTLLQATLSAALSLGLAIPLARALTRRAFPGRGLFIALLGAPFILPVIVAIFGLLAIFGQQGWINSGLGFLGLGPIRIYGLHGVVLAHVFFNLPLATRMLLQGWAAIPGEQFRNAAALGFAPADIQRHLEWPMLRAVAPGVALVVFAICLTSFAVALTLGGGPRATTIELAIYQAFQFEFDLGKAALLSMIQLGIAGAAALAAAALVPSAGFGAGLDMASPALRPRGIGLRLVDAIVVTLAGAFLLGPLLSVVLSGLWQVAELPGLVWHAALRSVLVALASVAITMVLALSMALAASGAAAPGRRLVEVAGVLPIAASPLVLGTGAFLVIFPVADPVALALGVTALVNALASLPFALRVLLPHARALAADYGRLTQSLGMSAGAQLRWVVIPRLRRPLGFAAGLSGALSVGDLGVIALFANPERATLPLAMYQLMGAYRLDEAAGAAVLLLIACLALFWTFDFWGRRDVAA